MDETERRREMQLSFNRENDITPKTIQKALTSNLADLYNLDYFKIPDDDEEKATLGDGKSMEERIQQMEKEMFSAAKDLEFERAAKLRDTIKALREKQLLDPRYGSM